MPAPSWKRRERPGVYQTFTEPFLLRLSDEQRERVERAARFRSKSRSDFMRDAIMAYTLGVEEEQEAKRRARREERTGIGSRPSFGFSFRPLETPVPPLAPPPTGPSAPVASVAPTVVIHNVPAVPADEVSVLADYVLGARNSVDAEGRRRAVEKILLAREPCEERERLARALDARIAEREAVRKREESERRKSSLGWGLLAGGTR